METPAEYDTGDAPKDYKMELPTYNHAELHEKWTGHIISKKPHLHRHRTAYERREAGEKLQDISASMDISQERVRQIILRWKRELERTERDSLKPTPEPEDYPAKPTASKSLIIALLSDRPIAYHPVLAKALGGVKEAVFVSQLLYWTDKGKRGDGFIWKTQDEWTDETGLSSGEQRTARKHLKAMGVLQERLKSVPARLYYRLNTDALQTRIEEYLQQDVRDPNNKECGTLTAIPEITTETTQRKKPPLADSPPIEDSPDDIAEIAASFKKPPPREPRTAEQAQAGVRRALEAHARNGNSRAGVADPTHEADPWSNGPLLAFYAVVHRDPQHVKPSERKDWPRQLQKWASTWEDAAPTPQETVQCLKGITESEHAWKTFTSPRQTSFQETMDVMLSRLRGGQPFNAEGKANGGPSTGRRQTKQIISSDMVVM